MAHLLKLDAAANAAAAPESAIVCHDVRAPDSTILARKGSVLDGAEMRRLLRLSVRELHLAICEPGDLGEDAAATRLASAVSGPGVRLSPPHYGQVGLTSDARGLLRVDTTRLDRVNATPDVLVTTALPDVPTDAGSALGVVKCAPLLMPERTVQAVEAIGAVIQVVPFVARRVAFVAPAGRVRGNAMQLAVNSLAEALSWYGSTLATVLTPEASVGALCDAFEHAAAGGANLILGAGAAATDPMDVVFDGLRAAGGEVDQVGIPAEPGTACWIGQLHGLPVLGLASCELFGRPGALDLILPRLLVGEPLDRALMRRIALGGLLLGGPTRVAPFHNSAD